MENKKTYTLPYRAEKVEQLLRNAENAVLKTSQKLTPEEQAQARDNIGAIAGVEKLETAYLEFEQGGITSSNGANATGSNRLRSFYLSIADAIQVYSNNSAYNLYGHFYDASMAYVGNTGGWVGGFIVSNIKVRFPNASYFRIVVRKDGDPEITPSDAVGVFEMSYMKTVIGAESVLYTPQSLSKYQQAQARANIGVVPTLVVDASGDAWSHTFSEIKAHVEAGGFAVLTNGSEYFPLIYCSGQIIQFAALADDGYLYIYEMRNDNRTQVRDIAFIIDDALTTCLRYSKQALSASQQAQARENIGITGTGADGKDGYTPVKGTDYFTAEDKAEMVNAVIAALPVYTGEVV